MTYKAGTITNPAQPGLALYTAIANMLTTSDPTLATGGVAPPGGWSLVETYAPTPGAGGYTFSVWQSLGTSNHAGVTFYVIFQYQTATQSAGSPLFYVYMCETYTVATHNKNVCAMGSHYSSTQPVLASTTTPPWANTTAVSVSAIQPDEPYISIGIGTGSNFIALVANVDGLACWVADPTTVSGFYAGAFTTLVTNGANGVTDPNPLVLVNATGGAITSYIQYAYTTRDPGNTLSVGYGSPGGYAVYPFMPAYNANFSQANGTGGIAGTSPADVYVTSTAAQAYRVLLTKYCYNPPKPGVDGVIRGLLPTWLQVSYSNSCAFLDTVTESADSLVIIGTGAAGVWTYLVDTTTA